MSPILDINELGGNIVSLNVRNLDVIAKLAKLQAENNTRRVLSTDPEQVKLRNRQDKDLEMATKMVTDSQMLKERCRKALLAGGADLAQVCKDYGQALRLTEQSESVLNWRKPTEKETGSSDPSPSSPPLTPPVKTDDTRRFEPVPAPPDSTPPPKPAKATEKTAESKEPALSEIMAAIKATNLNPEYVDILKAYTPEELAAILARGYRANERVKKYTFSWPSLPFTVTKRPPNTK
jgi:hypothetical protein